MEAANREILKHARPLPRGLRRPGRVGFDLAKALLGVEGVPTFFDQARTVVRPAVDAVATMLGIDPATLLAAVETAWLKVRFPGDPLTRAFDRAREAPIEPVGLRCGARLELFVSVCWYLQRAAGDEPIVVPLERIAALLGVTWRAVSNYRASAVRDGLLIEVDKTWHYAKGEPARAKTYRFNFDSPHVARPEWDGGLTR